MFGFDCYFNVNTNCLVFVSEPMLTYSVSRIYFHSVI